METSTQTPAPDKRRLFDDPQDAVLVTGFVTLEAGVAFIYWPAALILCGLLCFLVVGAIQRANAVKTAEKV